MIPSVFREIEKSEEIVLLRKIEQNRYSMVSIGYSALGRLFVFEWEFPASYWVVVDNGGGSSSFIKTSPIKKIIKKTKNRIVFETQTSVYELIRNLKP